MSLIQTRRNVCRTLIRQTKCVQKAAKMASIAYKGNVALHKNIMGLKIVDTESLQFVCRTDAT